MSDDAEMMVPFYIAANAALRGRAEAAEALAGDLAQAGAKAEAEIDALRARAEAAEQRAEDLAAELAQARAEGEAAGRAAERAQIAAWLREHSDGAPSGLWDAYALTLMASRIRAGDVVPDIGAGEHVGALGTTR